MHTVYVLTCLVAAVAAAPQLSPLADSYLPPNPEPTYPQETSSCPPVADIYKTKYVSVPVNKVVEKTTKVLVPEEKYVYRTQIVPREVIRKVEKTKVVPVPEVKIVVKSVVRNQYKTVSQRGEDQIVEKVVIRNVPVVKVKYVTVTKEVVKTVPKVVVKKIVQTQVVPKVVEVPEISYETKIEVKQLPDNIRTVVKYVDKVVYKTETLPPKVVYRTVVQKVTKTEMKEEKLPARTVTQDRVQYKTVTKEVVKIQPVPQVVKKEQVNYVTKTEVKYVNREVVVPSVRVEERVVKVTETKVEVRERPVSQTSYRTVTVEKVQKLPAKTVTDVKVKYVTSTDVIPGEVRTVVKDKVNVRTVTKVNNVVKEQTSVVYKTKVVKQPCGYNYDAPKNPLIF